MLGNSGQNVHRQPVGLGEVHGNELNTSFHKGANEVDIASEAIKLGNDEGGTVQSAEPESLGNGRAVVSLPAFDLNHFLDECPASAVEVPRNRFALSFESKAASALP